MNLSGTAEKTDRESLSSSDEITGLYGPTAPQMTDVCAFATTLPLLGSFGRILVAMSLQDGGWYSSNQHGMLDTRRLQSSSLNLTT